MKNLIHTSKTLQNKNLRLYLGRYTFVLREIYKFQVWSHKSLRLFSPIYKTRSPIISRSTYFIIYREKEKVQKHNQKLTYAQAHSEIVKNYFSLLSLIATCLSTLGNLAMGTKFFDKEGHPIWSGFGWVLFVAVIILLITYLILIACLLCRTPMP